MARRLLFVVALVVGLALPTAIQTLPAPADLGSRFATNGGDPVFLMWTMAWESDALADGHPTQVLQGNQFFPAADTIAWSDTLLLYLPVFGPLYLATDNPVLAFNATVFAAYLAGALAAYGLALALLGRRWPAFLAALVFTLAPYRSLSLSHPQLAGFVGVPLALLFVVRFLRRRRWPDALGLGATLGATFLITAYYAVMLVLVLVVTVAVWALAHRRSLVDRRIWVGSAIAAVAAAALVAPLLPTYRALSDDGVLTRTTGEVSAYTARQRYFTEVPPSLVYRALHDDPGAQGRDLGGYWPGAVLLLGLVVGLAGGAVGRGRPRRTPDAGGGGGGGAGAGAGWTEFGVPLAAAATVCALVMIGPGPGVASVPYEGLRAVVPGLAGIRDVGRFWMMPLLVGAIASARGFDRLVARVRVGTASARIPAAVFLVLGAVAVAELLYRPLLADIDLSPRATAGNRALVALPRGAVTEVPTPSTPDGSTYPFVVAARLLRSTIDGRPRVEGYSAHHPGAFLRAVDAASAFPSEEGVRGLQRAGVRFVLVRGGARTPCSSSAFTPVELRRLVATAGALTGVERVIPAEPDAIVELRPGTGRGPAPPSPLPRYRSDCPDQ